MQNPGFAVEKREQGCSGELQQLARLSEYQ